MNPDIHFPLFQPPEFEIKIPNAKSIRVRLPKYTIFILVEHLVESVVAVAVAVALAEDEQDA